MRLLTILTGCAALLLAAQPLLAQDCPILEQRALDALDTSCEALEPGQICAVHPELLIHAYDGGDPIEPETGDILLLADMQALGLGSDAQTWGVMRAAISAYPVDSWDAEAVTAFFFGDMVAFNSGAEGIEVTTERVPITLLQGVNVRSGPSVDASAMLPLLRGDVVKATGRSADGSWLRIQQRSGEGGWIAADLVEVDMDALATVTADDSPPAPLYRPYADFSFNAALNDARCENAPSSGILLQTPAESEALDFMINGVRLQLSGTVYLQAEAEQSMIVSVLAGRARVTAEQVNQLLHGHTNGGHERLSDAPGRLPQHSGALRSSAPAEPARASTARSHLRGNGRAPLHQTASSW